MASGGSDSLVQAANEYFDTLIKSRFIEMFGTDVNPKYGHIKVGEVVSKKIGRVSKQFSTDSIIQYIDIASIDKDSKRILNTTEYIVSEAPSRAQQCVEEGDILLSNVRPNLKTISIVHLPGSNLVCSTGFSVLRCVSYLPEYLLVAISSDLFTEHLMSKATGSSYPAVTTKDVMNQTIPAAPLELQNQFADFVKQVDKSKLIFQQMVSRFDELVKSRFIEMFTPGKFQQVLLGDVCKTISGGTPSTKVKEYYENGTIPWINSGEVDGNITYSKQKITQLGLENSSAKMIPVDSVMVAMYGATVGEVGILKIHACSNQAICSILPNEHFNPEYLAYCLRMKKPHFLSLSIGGAQPNISQKIIRETLVDLPPIELQNQFADFVKQVDKTKSEILEGVKRLRI